MGRVEGVGGGVMEGERESFLARVLEKASTMVTL